MRLGGGWRGRARRLTVWVLVSLSPGRGGGVYKAGGVGVEHPSWASCGPRTPTQGALGRLVLLSWSRVTLSGFQI